MDKQAPVSGVLLAVLASVVAGCARVPYVPGRNIEGQDTYRLPPGEPQIERGARKPFLDGLGHYVLSLPTKAILWNWRVDNHRISPKTEAKLEEYLADNDLHHVKVRLNQYTPGAEWRRLFRNEAVGRFWRYTFGLVAVAAYTAFPGRAFGGDNYNPYTNTINLYSDHKGIALHEAAHAKDFATRRRKGLYATLRVVPFLALYQEAVATGDAIGYDRWKGRTRDEKADYKVLYPAFATYIAGEALRWVSVDWWVQYAVQAAAVVPAHIVGRIKAACVRPRPVAGGSAMRVPAPSSYGANAP